MAKYTITKACGCEEVVNITGKIDQRDSKADYLSGFDCWDCKKKKEQEEANKNSSDMPELQGSEKQVAWAIIIREKMRVEIEKNIKNIDKLIHELSIKIYKTARRSGTEATFKRIGSGIEVTIEGKNLIITKEVVEALRKQLLENVHSSFWINNREESIIELLTTVYLNK